MKKIISLFMTFAFIHFMLPEMYLMADEKNISHTLCTVLTEATTGTVINGKNENLCVPQGTLPKLMTVLLTAEEIECGNLSFDTIITAGSEVENQPGAVIWLTQGEAISVDDLLKAVIIGNANDASAVLAAYIGKSEKDFVGMMNARAFELGMRNTVYKSCSGTDQFGEYTTAYDMAILAGEILKYNFLTDYFTSWTDTVRGGQTEVVNENRLVRSYDGLTGMKAGHSDKSGYTLVLTAEKEDTSFISVILGCDDKDERFNMGKSLLNTGFSSYKVTTPAFSDEFLKPVSVHGGVDKAVQIQAGELNELVIPKNSGELSTAVLIPEYVEAPITKGQILGKIGFYNDDTLLFETDLVASQDVKKINFKMALTKYLYTMYK